MALIQYEQRLGFRSEHVDAANGKITSALISAVDFTGPELALGDECDIKDAEADDRGEGMITTATLFIRVYASDISKLDFSSGL